MRLAALILVGISALGCGNKEAAKPAKGSAEGTATTYTPPDHAPALPKKDESTQVLHDEAWAKETAKTIQAVAPDLSNVTCHQIDCSATLTAKSEEELVSRAEKLQSEDSLHQLDDARGIVLSAPTKADGKVSMTIRILFDQ